jgi:hypothetical protein
MVYPTEVLLHIVCIHIRCLAIVILVDVIENKQPLVILPLSQPVHDLPGDCIDVASTPCSIYPTRLGSLAIGYPARTTGDILCVTLSLLLPSN